MTMPRPDRMGAHRANYEKNKKRILATQNICGICGKPVDFTLKYPHPMSATIDHIIPVNGPGGLQGIHRLCQFATQSLFSNRQKVIRYLKIKKNQKY